MIAEVLLDAVDQTCETKTNFGTMSAEARAIDLPHEGVGGYFLEAFDRPKRVSVCECERSPGATLAQVLLLANSSEVDDKISGDKSRPSLLVKANKPPREMIEALYLAAYSRLPTEEEFNILLGPIEVAKDEPQKRKALEDILWSLLNTKEFLFNH